MSKTVPRLRVRVENASVHENREPKVAIAGRVAAQCVVVLAAFAVLAVVVS